MSTAFATKAVKRGFLNDRNFTPWFLRKPSQQLYNELLFPELVKSKKELEKVCHDAWIMNPYVVEAYCSKGRNILGM